MLLYLNFVILVNVCYVNGVKLNNLKTNANYDAFTADDERKLEDILQHLNRVIVKRVVPHGFETKRIEYDEKSKTFYKPTVRFHNGKQIDIPFVSDDERNVINISNELHNYETSQITQRGELSKTKHSKNKANDAIKLLVLLGQLRGKVAQRSGDATLKDVYENYKDVVFKHLDKKYGDGSVTKKEFLNRALNQVRTIKEKKDFFRALVKAFPFLRAGETEVDIKESIFLDQDETDQTEKPKLNLPYYPYWNYWTYQKTLYHDNCKKGWVRYHNMCIEIPPQS